MNSLSNIIIRSYKPTTATKRGRDLLKALQTNDITIIGASLRRFNRRRYLERMFSIGHLGNRLSYGQRLDAMKMIRYQDQLIAHFISDKPRPVH